MLEDDWLKLRFNAGSRDAMRCVYEKYRNDLLTLAMALLNDSYLSEDVLHDVFVTFAQSAHGVSVRGNLRSFLLTCVANRARDRLRAGRRQSQNAVTDLDMASGFAGPESSIIADEESRLVSAAMEQLPYEQREVVALHLSAAMTFRQIARVQSTSISTTKGRYRYGIAKLRSLLNGKL